jgi:hypothetical protein
MKGYKMPGQKNIFKMIMTFSLQLMWVRKAKLWNNPPSYEKNNKLHLRNTYYSNSACVYFFNQIIINRLEILLQV